MRLKKEQIQKIAGLILTNLKGKKLITPRVPEEKIRTKIIEIITTDLMAEVKLEEEARRMLDQYRPQIESGQVDERKAFLMIKKQLAKERKMIL